MPVSCLSNKQCKPTEYCDFKYCQSCHVVCEKAKHMTRECKNSCPDYQGRVSTTGQPSTPISTKAILKDQAIQSASLIMPPTILIVLMVICLLFVILLLSFSIWIIQQRTRLFKRNCFNKNSSETDRQYKKNTNFISNNCKYSSSTDMNISKNKSSQDIENGSVHTIGRKPQLEGEKTTLTTVADVEQRKLLLNNSLSIGLLPDGNNTSDKSSCTSEESNGSSSRDETPLITHCNVINPLKHEQHSLKSSKKSDTVHNSLTEKANKKSVTNENQYANILNSNNGSTKRKNKHIYDDLRRIPWVEGYYSEGQSIQVFVDLETMEKDWVLKSLQEATGQLQSKFHIKPSSELTY